LLDGVLGWTEPEAFLFLGSFNLNNNNEDTYYTKRTKDSIIIVKNTPHL
jgi:hypothetical protein